jgi:glycine hydroxymethyltransferase
LAAATWLAAANMVANKNLIPFDTRSPMETSGIRLGTPAVTSRGMGCEQMKDIASWIDAVLDGEGNPKVIARVRKQVLEACQAYPVPNSNGN